MNNLLYIVFNFSLQRYLGSLFSETYFLCSFEGSNTQIFALPYLLILIVFFLLAKQALRMFPQRMSG